MYSLDICFRTVVVREGRWRVGSGRSCSSSWARYIVPTMWRSLYVRAWRPSSTTIFLILFARGPTNQFPIFILTRGTTDRAANIFTTTTTWGWSVNGAWTQYVYCMRLTFNIHRSQRWRCMRGMGQEPLASGSHSLCLSFMHLVQAIFF